MSEVKVDTISERTAANGVAVDGVTIKDSGLTIPSGGTLTVASGATIDVTSATKTGFPSGGLQHITTVATTTDSSSIDIPACFSSTYQNYCVVMNNVMPVTDSTTVYMQFGNSDLSTIRPAYQFMLIMWSASSGAHSFYSANGTTTGVEIAHSMSNNILYGVNMTFWIYAPYESTTHTAFSGQGETFNNLANWGNTYMCTGSVSGTATQDESLRIIAASGNMDGNTLNRVSVYGLAES